MLTILFFGIQMLSLGIMLLFIHEYKRITYKHQEMLEMIEHDTPPKCTFYSTIIIWIYVIVTLTILIGTTTFFYSIIPSF